MVRPECDQAFDEWTIAGDARLQRGSRFTARQIDQTTTRLAALLLVSLTRCAKRPQGIANRRWGSAFARANGGSATIELCLEPAAGVGDPLTLAAASAQSESIERTKCDIHTAAPSRQGDPNPDVRTEA